MFFIYLILFASLAVVVRGISIEDFGAISDVDTIEAALHNAEAFHKALRHASAALSDREVLIPENRVYYMGFLNASNTHDMIIRVDGTIRFTNHFVVWGTEAESQLLFENCEGIRLMGSGLIDGQGLHWWRMAYIGRDIRPKLVRFRTTKDIVVEGLTFLNSPTFHVIFEDSANVIIHDITIFVDSHLLRGLDRHDSIMYPLNTDGLDIRATNVTVYNNNITNYDDAIVVKPCSTSGVHCQCAGDLLAYNNTIQFSTGLAIGSVSPGINGPCVRNVTFRDTYLYRPLKGIYVKPNPKRTSDDGYGTIDQITFENIVIEQAVWWTIWIGPQQMNQPGEEEGTGCNFLYPFIPECPTQPLVTMTNIKLINVTAIDTLPLFEGPGVILCDPMSPCTDFEFTDVSNVMYPGNATDIMNNLPWPFTPPQIVFPTKNRSDDWAFEYITQNVYGTVTNSDPKPCMNDENCW